MKYTVMLIGLLVLFSGCGEKAPDYMIKIEGGSYEMGNGRGRKEEQPLHLVRVNTFYMAKFELSQAFYDSIMGDNPSEFEGKDLPVETVSWHDAIQFCNKLSQLEGLSLAYAFNGERVIWDKNADGYRLPTEAEWEYAARGGQKDIPSTFSGGNEINGVSWNSDNSQRKSHAVGKKRANELGLYDMSGNILEWVWDWDSLYPDAPRENPTGPAEGTFKILRGGSWGVNHIGHRVSYRNTRKTDYKNNFIGFRIVKNGD